MADKRLDNAWGKAGLALLPESLRALWADEPLPEWVVSELKLEDGVTTAALDQSVWEVTGDKNFSSRLRNFILNLIAARRNEIRPIIVFTRPLPYWLNIRDLSFSTRTRNCVGALPFEPEELSKITYGRLFDTRSMGAVSILEFACTIEGALERASNSAAEPPRFNAEDLLSIISEDWVDKIGPADPRFSDILPHAPYPTLFLPHAPYLTLFELLENLTSGPDADRQLLEQLSNVLPELQKRISQIGSLSLEDQLKDFLHALSRFEGERLSAMMDRLGWSGSRPITLEEAGSLLGITRERLRQLQEKVTSRLNEISFPVYMPALDAALQLLRENSPINDNDASELLKAKGISTVSFHPESVIAAAEACGRKPPLCLQTFRKRTVVTTTDFPNADIILQVAYRQASASGASNVEEVVSELKHRGIDLDIGSVRDTLRKFSNVTFVEEQWFCNRPNNLERNRLRNVTRQMLSVTAPIELGLLRDGIRRKYQYRGHRGIKTWPLLVPPRSILRHYYRLHPQFEIDDEDRVRPVEPLDYRTELALNDAILVDALRSVPTCVLDRASFWAECERRSMNINTFAIYSTYSPIIVHLGTDLWSLRGVQVDPAAVEAVRYANAMRPKERRVLDHGWTSDGRLWVAARLPSAYGSFVFAIPGGIKRFVAGRHFAIKDEDGINYGSIRVNDEGASYGFGPFIRQRGADEGDILIAAFDLNSSTASLRLGDDELLEEISPET